MRRPANTLLDVALVLGLCAFVAWPAWAERPGEEKLPFGSIIRYTHASLWQQYGENVIAGGFWCSIAGLIIALLLHRKRRKQAEVALQRTQADLVHVTRVLMMGDLIVPFAHEITQPLAAVLYNAQAAQRFLAQDTPDLPAVQAALADIIEDDKRAIEIIHRLRGLLRKSPTEILLVNLNQVIREVVKLLNSDVIIRHIRLVLELAPDLPLVCGDRVQLQQVLINLLLNGCEAMAEVALDHRQLGIRTQQVGTQMVEVAVHDGGVGLHEHGLEQIFEPFYTTKPAGMGMGLAISRTIVEAHGGRLWAANNPDRGATLYFTLPVNEVEA